jgi:hypothetical protein
MMVVFLCVIPAKAGIHRVQEPRDSRWSLSPQLLRGDGSDDDWVSFDTLRKRNPLAAISLRRLECQHSSRGFSFPSVEELRT